MDMNLFRKALASKQKLDLTESSERYATKYPGFTITLPPSKNGTIILANGEKIALSAGDVVDIVTTQGHSYKGVKLDSVIDDKHEGLGGKVRFAQNGGILGMSGNGIASLKKK